MTHGIVLHLIAIPWQMYLTHVTTRTTRGHDHKFKIPFSRIQSHQNSYFPSAIRTWNSLPAVLIIVPTLEAFKMELAHAHVYMYMHSHHSFNCMYYIFWEEFLHLLLPVWSTGTCFIKKIYAPSSSLRQGMKQVPVVWSLL